MVRDASPDVSVIIPTYNRKELLQQAIASCFAGNEALDVEVVVVDDGSTDGTRGYLQELDDARVRPKFQEHQGGQVARNRGLTEARGEYIKFLDDDDWLAEGALTREVNTLEATEAELCYGSYLDVNQEGQVIRKRSSPYPEDLITGVLRGTANSHPLHLTYRRSLIQELRWDPEIIGRQDVQFLTDVALQEPCHVREQEPVGYRRHHGGRQQGEYAAQRTNLARVHASILIRAINTLEREGRLTPKRRKAAAEGLWRWAHILSAYDWRGFQKVYKNIQKIRPDFIPSRTSSILGALDRIGGPAITEALLYPLRRVKQKTMYKQN